MNTSQPSPPLDAASRLLTSLSQPTRLLVSVSGGSDSTGLLIALHQVTSQPDCPHSLTAATVDHALRPDSADEALAVARLCASLEIPHRILTWQGDKPRTGISSTAREARYRLLADAAVALDATAIVTGHTADDQDETITMRAARADEDSIGLSGMASATLYDRRIWLLRPFLEVRRAAIRDYLTGQAVGWVDDPSNADRRFERVRVRQDRGAAMPGSADEAAARRRLLSKGAADLIAASATLHAGCLITLSPAARNAEPAILRHALTTLVAIVGGRPHRPATAAMDRLMRLVTSGKPGRMTLARALVQCRRDGLYLMREIRDVLPRTLPPHSALLWDGRYRITNPTGEALQIAPGTDLHPSPEADALSPAIRTHMARVSPQIRAVSALAGGSHAPPAHVTVEPAFPLFDRFLAETDLPLADAVARLFGARAYLPPPA
ncbi:MAG: tRNA lysidine(34) synthetase TilS [Rhizobium sp.]|nr:tRNA lysidine(34) synthetase TilS [Rhizobium sp.]